MKQRSTGTSATLLIAAAVLFASSSNAALHPKFRIPLRRGGALFGWVKEDSKERDGSDEEQGEEGSQVVDLSAFEQKMQTIVETSRNDVRQTFRRLQDDLKRHLGGERKIARKTALFDIKVGGDQTLIAEDDDATDDATASFSEIYVETMEEERILDSLEESEEEVPQPVLRMKIQKMKSSYDKVVDQIVTDTTSIGKKLKSACNPSTVSAIAASLIAVYLLARIFMDVVLKAIIVPGGFPELAVEHLKHSIQELQTWGTDNISRWTGLEPERVARWLGKKPVKIHPATPMEQAQKWLSSSREWLQRVAL